MAGWIKDTTGTFENAFIMAACVFVAGAAVSLVLRQKREAPREATGPVRLAGVAVMTEKRRNEP